MEVLIGEIIRSFPKMFAFLDAEVAPGYLCGDSFNTVDRFLMPILAVV